MASLQENVFQQQPIDGTVDIDRSFEVWINRSLERSPELAKKINFVYQINIKRNSNSISSWILDLTSANGSLYKDPKREVKCSITLDENDLIRVILDHNHWNTLFLKRKLTLKGSRVALEKLQQFWVESQKYNKDFELIRRSTNEESDVNRNVVDSFVSNGFKSDIIFHTLRNRMHEEEDIVGKLTGIMEFDITKNKRKSVWTIDFTKPLGQNVYPGPSKTKPICVLSMEDEDFVKMMVNKFNPQKAFMMGKMKVKGQILAIYKLFTVWIESAFKKKKAPELPYIEQILLSSDLIPGLKSEIIIFQVIQRLIKNSQLCSELGQIYYFDITKNGKVVSKWKLDLKSNPICGIFSRNPLHIESPSETLIIIDDEDFSLMAINKLDIEKAMSSNRIKGDISLAPKLAKIFQMTLIQSKL